MSDTKEILMVLNRIVDRLPDQIITPLDNSLFSRGKNMKRESEYQKRWVKNKTESGWKFVCWLLPPKVQMSLKQYKKYLMDNYKQKLL